MNQTPMTAARRRAMGRGDLMGKLFLKNLDAGALLDRTTVRCQGKSIARMAVPEGLKKLARGGELLSDAEGLER